MVYLICVVASTNGGIPFLNFKILKISTEPKQYMYTDILNCVYILYASIDKKAHLVIVGLISAIDNASFHCMWFKPSWPLICVTSVTTLSSVKVMLMMPILTIRPGMVSVTQECPLQLCPWFIRCCKSCSL